MDKESLLKRPKSFRQRYFTAKELQFSIALLIVIALLGGIFLQSVSSAFISYFGYNTPMLGVLLVIGYILIVVLLAIAFTHRLIGPFKRLEYEMKFISTGDISRRLSIRSQDDLHVRNFVNYTNNFLAKLEDMSKAYNGLNSVISGKMKEIGIELSKENIDCKKIQHELERLQKELDSFRKRW